MLNNRIQTAIRFPPNLYEQLKREAEQLGISINALVCIRLAETKEEKE